MKPFLIIFSGENQTKETQGESSVLAVVTVERAEEFWSDIFL